MRRTPPWFAILVTAAAVGRLIILLLLHEHWHWQPPYHLTYLHPAQGYDAATGEYLIAHMPLYPAFLDALAMVPGSLYVIAPALQTLLQLCAIGWLASTLRAVVADWRPLVIFAFALGLDPWLCDTAILMQPAALTGSLFIVLIERTIAASAGALSRGRMPWGVTIATAGVLSGVAATVRADFAAYTILPAAAIALVMRLAGRTSTRQALGFAVGGGAASIALVLAVLMPRALWLRPHTGAIVLTTYTGAGTSWFGLGEIPNPWQIPNPEGGDEPIEAFARAHGYRHAYTSARTAAFFNGLFQAHVRERPAFVMRLILHRLYRVAHGWPPGSITFRGEYEAWPQLRLLGEQLDRGHSKFSLLLTREHGPWVLKQFGLRYLGTMLIWLCPLGAVWFAARRDAHPLLLLPLLAYATAVGPFILVHWSYRYGQQFYWLGSLSVVLIWARQAAAGAADGTCLKR